MRLIELSGCGSLAMYCPFLMRINSFISSSDAWAKNCRFVRGHNVKGVRMRLCRLQRFIF